MKHERFKTPNLIEDHNHRIPAGWLVYAPNSSITFQERVNQNTTQPYAVVAVDPEGLEFYDANNHPLHHYLGKNKEGEALICEGNWAGIC